MKLTTVENSDSRWTEFLSGAQTADPIFVDTGLSLAVSAPSQTLDFLESSAQTPDKHSIPVFYPLISSLHEPQISQFHHALKGVVLAVFNQRRYQGWI